MMTRLFRILSALALASSLAAQTTRTVDWPELNRRTQGKSAVFHLRGGETVTGAVSAGAEADAVRVGARTVGCADIASVEARKKSKRALWAVVGGAAGLAAGAVLGTRFENEGNDGAAAGLAAGLAGAGAAIGYLAGGKGKTQTLVLAPGSCPAP